eukprot:COSAG01_NODE_47596_length_388_cov_28.280277_1_plen_83_part_10
MLCVTPHRAAGPLDGGDRAAGARNWDGRVGHQGPTAREGAAWAPEVLLPAPFQMAAMEKQCTVLIHNNKLAPANAADIRWVLH